MGKTKYFNFFITMLTIVLLSGVASLIGPIFLQIWEAKQLPLTITRIIIIVILITVSKLLTVLLTVYRERFAKEYNKKNFVAMLYDYLKMDYDYTINEGPSNLLEKIGQAVNSIYSYMTGDHIKIWSQIIVGSACLLLIGSINLWLALVMLVALPINYLGFRLLNKELAKRAKEMQQQTSTGFQEILSYVQQVDYLKQLADYKSLVKNLSPSIEKIYGSMARINEFAQSATAMLEGVTSVIQNVILMLIVYSFFNNGISPYMLMLSTIVLPLYFSSVSSITESNINKRDFNVALALQEELKAHTETDATGTLDNIETIELAVEKLIFAEQEVAFDARAKLIKGDIVKICGESGTGKSTFAKTLLKYRPIEGVSINRIPINQISNTELRKRIEFVPQNIPIIRGSLRDNLLLGKDQSKSRDEYFAKSPFLQSILEHKSLDDEILENGANLSGGEKQKIAIVRALIEEPDVLILDEICSNIDEKMADSIYELLKDSRGNRITMIITHDNLPDGLVNIELNQGNLMKRKKQE